MVKTRLLNHGLHLAEGAGDTGESVASSSGMVGRGKWFGRFGRNVGLHLMIAVAFPDNREFSVLI